MKRATIGVRMHSGWGVLVAVSGDAEEVDIVDRRNVVIWDPGIPGAKQPYHYAAKLGCPEAQRYLENCGAVCERLAVAAVGDAVRKLRNRHFQVAASVVLQASGRLLPPLPKILASHALIHTTEGEFFRNAVRGACVHLRIAVAGLPERDLDKRAKAVFGNAADRIQRRILRMGKSLGAPWRQDQKAAALAAAIVLAGNKQDHSSDSAAR